MKRFFWLVPIFLLFAAGVYAQSLKGKTVYLNVKTAPVKSSAGVFADTVGNLSYGDSVTVLQQKDNWAEVKATQSSLTGWTSAGNLTTKRIIASGGASASADELALAGKGFNAEVEKSYRQDDSLNYKDVDAMESSSLPDDKLHEFIVNGRLKGGE